MDNQTTQQNSILTSSTNLPKQGYTFSTNLLLIAGFLFIVSFFDIADVYQNHFFDTGLIVFIYNLARCLFAAYIIWILYVSGMMALGRISRLKTLDQFTVSERIVLGFGTGAGVWHIIMFLLGMANLYYKPLILTLCIIVLAASGKYFSALAAEIRKNRALNSSRNIKSRMLSYTIGISIGVSIFWLLLVRGLFPGGGGDYYTHYFYYYINVIKNHGLAPNDVWYHYYYSKGAGLYFLGMLLTDPEAPQIITFCFVAIAAISMRTITERFAPRTLWPIVCPLLYIFYNLVGLSKNGGEFQKIHEETTALIVLCTWSICMLNIGTKEWRKPLFFMLTVLMISGAILTQAMVVFFGFFFGIVTLLALIGKDWPRLKLYFLLGAIGSISVIGTLFINYLVTGLATDQALNVTWKFANLERLSKWGVVPNVMMVAWIRDNYDLVAAPYGWSTLSQLSNFMRLNYLWVLLLGTLIAISIRIISKISYRDGNNQQKINSHDAYNLNRTLIDLAILILTFAILSIFSGHSQEVSYFRFSSFFFPLLALFCTLCLIRLYHPKRALGVILPIIIVFSVAHSWNHWSTQAGRATQHAMRFMKGKFSLAQAYKHQQSGLAFGGINNGALEAVRHTPKGSRVWSTNVDSYCMAPNCQIESVISFKLSSRLNEILNDSPAQAQRILQEEGLNYFIFSTESLLLDLLPYSQLFDPDNISRYLGIAWSDNKTYLLTWRSQSTKPLNKEFLTLYKTTLEKSQHPWFRFNEALPQMAATMKLLKSSPHPWKTIEFPWRATTPKNGINVIKASYGKNCSLSSEYPYFHSIDTTRVTNTLKSQCDSKTTCKLPVSFLYFGDPAKGCQKDFRVTYQCMNHPFIHEILLAKEAKNKSILIDCGAIECINIIRATQGSVCFTLKRPYIHLVAKGNATNAISTRCNGKISCSVDIKDLHTDNNEGICSNSIKAYYFCNNINGIANSITEKMASGKHINFSC